MRRILPWLFLFAALLSIFAAGMKLREQLGPLGGAPIEANPPQGMTP